MKSFLKGQPQHFGLNVLFSSLHGMQSLRSDVEERERNTQATIRFSPSDKKRQKNEKLKEKKA